MEKTKNTTIKDIARYAGVSIGTVSKVMNKQGNVKEVLRLRVEAHMIVGKKGAMAILLNAVTSRLPRLSASRAGSQVERGPRWSATRQVRRVRGAATSDTRLR